MRSVGDLHDVQSLVSLHTYFTDGFTIKFASTAAVFMPGRKPTLSIKLSHKKSPTVSELMDISKALKYINAQTPDKWIIFTHSKTILQALESINRHGVYFVSLMRLQCLQTTCCRRGHVFCFFLLQWISGHYDSIGNDSADKTARNVNENVTSVAILYKYFRTDAATAFRQAAKELT